MMDTFFSKTCFLLLALSSFAVSLDLSQFQPNTVCSSLISGENTVQGVILHAGYPEGALLVADRVFPFDTRSDLNSAGNVHYLHLKHPGVPVEKYYPGVYLQDGSSSIFNAYGLLDESSSSPGIRLVNFLLTNSQFTGNFTFVPGTSPTSGFQYNYQSGLSTVLDNSLVPPTYPMAYFSNNANRTYLYQIHVFTFQARASFEKRKNSGYFAFNALDRQMDFYQVSNLHLVEEEAQRKAEVLRGKAPVRSGFIFGEAVYLFTSESVYVLKKTDFERNPLAKATKLSLEQFFKCYQTAILDHVALSETIHFLLISSMLGIVAILLLLILVQNYRQAAVKEARQYMQGNQN